MSEEDPISGALAAWRAATDGLVPPPSLADSVMDRARHSLWGQLAKSGRRAVWAAALGAALLSLVALRSVRTLEDRVSEVALTAWAP